MGPSIDMARSAPIGIGHLPGSEFAAAAVVRVSAEGRGVVATTLLEPPGVFLEAFGVFGGDREISAQQLLRIPRLGLQLVVARRLRFTADGAVTVGVLR